MAAKCYKVYFRPPNTATPLCIKLANFDMTVSQVIKKCLQYLQKKYPLTLHQLSMYSLYIAHKNGNKDTGLPEIAQEQKIKLIGAKRFSLQYDRCVSTINTDIDLKKKYGIGEIKNKDINVGCCGVWTWV